MKLVTLCVYDDYCNFRCSKFFAFWKCVSEFGCKGHLNRCVCFKIHNVFQLIGTQLLLPNFDEKTKQKINDDYQSIGIYVHSTNSGPILWESIDWNVNN